MSINKILHASSILFELKLVITRLLRYELRPQDFSNPHLEGWFKTNLWSIIVDSCFLDVLDAEFIRWVYIIYKYSKHIEYKEKFLMKFPLGVKVALVLQDNEKTREEKIQKFESFLGVSVMESYESWGHRKSMR